MKERILAAVLCGILIAGLAGCGNTAEKEKEENPVSTVTADITSDNKESGDIPASPSAPADSASEPQIPAEEKESPAESASPEQTSKARTPAWAEEQKPAQSSSVPIESSKQEAQSMPPKEPEPQESKPATAPSSAEEPPQREPEQETAPPEEPTIPDFNIQAWISYAETYAVSVGLELDSSAVDCWDNPITAGAECIYLQRDIESRLNRYARDEDITDVWIWAEQRADGDYDLYIGYA